MATLHACHSGINYISHCRFIPVHDLKVISRRRFHRTIWYANSSKQGKCQSSASTNSKKSQRFALCMQYHVHAFSFISFSDHVVSTSFPLSMLSDLLIKLRRLGLRWVVPSTSSNSLLAATAMLPPASAMRRWYSSIFLLTSKLSLVNSKLISSRDLPATSG